MLKKLVLGSAIALTAVNLAFNLSFVPRALADGSSSSSATGCAATATCSCKGPCACSSGAGTDYATCSCSDGTQQSATCTIGGQKAPLSPPKSD